MVWIYTTAYATVHLILYCDNSDPQYHWKVFLKIEANIVNPAFTKTLQEITEPAQQGKSDTLGWIPADVDINVNKQGSTVCAAANANENDNVMDDMQACQAMLLQCLKAKPPRQQQQQNTDAEEREQVTEMPCFVDLMDGTWAKKQKEKTEREQMLRNTNPLCDATFQECMEEALSQTVLQVCADANRSVII